MRDEAEEARDADEPGAQWHRRGDPNLSRAVLTERFTLRPMEVLEAARFDRRIANDVEVRYMVTGSTKKRRKPFTYLQRPNGRSRFVHAILARDRDTPIGIHTIALRPWRNAYLGVILTDRAWWGKDVVIEVRRAVMRHFERHAGVEQFIGQVRARNFASVSNYMRLGFERTAVRYQTGWDPARDEPIDMFEFSLRKPAFAKVLHGEAT